MIFKPRSIAIGAFFVPDLTKRTLRGTKEADLRELIRTSRKNINITNLYTTHKKRFLKVEPFTGRLLRTQ
jgi:hypothetical protein